MSDTIEQVRNFVISNFLLDTVDTPLENDASFLDQGIIDSTGVLELIDWIEEKFNFTVTDEELVPANLDSIDNVVAFIERKTSSNANA